MLNNQAVKKAGWSSGATVLILLIISSSRLFFFFFLIYLFIYFWLCWVFVSVRRLSLVVVSGGHSSSLCAGLSPSWPLLLRSTGSRCAGSVIVAHGPSCSAACGIFPDQGSNPCPLHWQADSQPLRHQGSPSHHILPSFSLTAARLLYKGENMTVPGLMSSTSYCLSKSLERD